MKIIFIMAILWLMTLSASAKTPNIIIVTMDGVRSHEFFKGTSKFLDHQLKKSERGQIFKNVWNEMIPNGILYGNAGPWSSYQVADKFGISLPSYQTIFLGKDHGFKDQNRNPRVKDETFLERVKSELNLEKKQVAAIGSWHIITNALAKNPENIFINVGNQPLDDGTDDPVIQKINEEQSSNPPVWNINNHKDRADKYTWAHAIHYLKKHQPKLLYINLLDSDEFGHNADYPNYVKALKENDLRIKELMDLLKGDMKEYGEDTVVFLTTDHSRSYLWWWKDHGLVPYSERNIFLAVWGPNLKAHGKIRSLKKKNHFNIRPTVEALFGLKPSYKYQALKEVLK